MWVTRDLLVIFHWQTLRKVLHKITIIAHWTSSFNGCIIWTSLNAFTSSSFLAWHTVAFLYFAFLPQFLAECMAIFGKTRQSLRCFSCFAGLRVPQSFAHLPGTWNCRSPFVSRFARLADVGSISRTGSQFWVEFRPASFWEFEVQSRSSKSEMDCKDLQLMKLKSSTTFKRCEFERGKRTDGWTALLLHVWNTLSVQMARTNCTQVCFLPVASSFSPSGLFCSENTCWYILLYNL